MHATLRPLVASLGLFGAVTLVADVTMVWTGSADDQFTNPANWQQVYVPDARADANEALNPSFVDTILKGNTTFTEPVIVGSGVVQSPGNSPGIQVHTSGLELASGGQFDFEVQSAVGSPGSAYDLVRVSGGLLDITANSTPSSSKFTIKVISLNAAGTAGNVSNFSASGNYSWMLYEGNSASGIAGFAREKFILDLSSFTNPTGTGVFSLDLGTNAGNPAIFLNFTAVPEPSTYALLALGLGAAVIARRRRR